MAYDINLTAPNNQLNFKSLLASIWRLYSNMSVGLVGYDLIITLAVFVCGRLIRRYENLRNLEHMLSLFSSYVRSRDFSRRSECFGKILKVKPRQLSDLLYQNSRKTLRKFQKVLAAKVAGKQAQHVS